MSMDGLEKLLPELHELLLRVQAEFPVPAAVRVTIIMRRVDLPGIACLIGNDDPAAVLASVQRWVTELQLLSMPLEGKPQ